MLRIFNVVCWFGGAQSYIRWHRNITTQLIAFQRWRYWRSPSFAWSAKASTLAGRWALHHRAASHLILDLTNV